VVVRRKPDVLFPEPRTVTQLSGVFVDRFVRGRRQSFCDRRVYSGSEGLDARKRLTGRKIERIGEDLRNFLGPLADRSR
jgi:hypothetical protein